MQKAQAELLRQWTDLGLAWTRAATPGVPSAAAAGAPAAGATSAGIASPPPAFPAGDDIARNFLRQCEHYLGVSRSLWDLVGRAAATGDPEQRTRVFTDGLGGLQRQFAGLWAATPFGAATAAAGNPLAGAMPGLGAAGAMPGFGAMPGAAAFGFPGMGAMPGPGAMPGMAAMPGWPGAAFAGGFPGMGGLNLPALGPTRESQESWQRLAQLGTRYWQAQMQVGGQWNDIIGKSLRELGERLGPRLKSGAPPGSMKEIYDLWVDSAENVYAQAARGTAFMQAQAELTNSMSELRSAQRELLEEWAKQFDLPTRAELNSVHQQLRELKAALQRSAG